MQEEISCEKLLNSTKSEAFYNNGIFSYNHQVCFSNGNEEINVTPEASMSWLEHPVMDEIIMLLEMNFDSPNSIANNGLHN